MNEQQASKCGTCGTAEDFPANPGSELRPYGSGGAAICYRCGTGTPEAEAQSQANFAVIVDATHATGQPFVIGGPR